VSTVAILGAGPIGASIAHRLAQRARVRRIVLVDASGQAAAGKALDIAQSGPIDHFDTTIEAADDVRACASADVIVIADEHVEGEWQGDRGLTLVRQLVQAGMTAPMVFAGPSQTWLIEAVYRELKVPAARLIGSASAAMASAVRAIAGLEVGLSTVDLAVVGRPPALVVGWASATIQGTLLTDMVPAHRLLAISQAVPKLWPPKPYAIGTATSAIAEALVSGSRAHHYALTVVDGEFGARGSALMLPLQLGRGRVLSHALPSLSPQERTEFMNAVGRP